MPKSVAGLLLGLFIAMPLAAGEPASTTPASMAPGAAPSDKEALEQFRSDLQAVETEVISKSVSLTAEEATKFWPIFQRFQSEQKAIIEGQMAAVRKYAEAYDKLSDQDATAYVNALLQRDQRVHDLRLKYLAEYSKVLSPGKAARVIHITRRLGLVSQVKLSSALPLVR